MTAISNGLPRLLATLTAVVGPAAHAECVCYADDALPTLITITVDGTIGDWSPVHADPDNNTCDGPVNGIVDRDAPVQATGRDLTHFAYTWDASALYLFTERGGSANNVQRFVYYADTDNDALMETGEPVIGADWRGSNRQVDLYFFTYVASQPGGDPMVNTSGFADGYRLPGSFANISSSPSRSGSWGSVDGRQMEFGVFWSELGVAPGSPVTFHVSSSNASLGSASFTNQIDDNLSGCDGLLGSTRSAGVQFVPDRLITGLAGNAAAALHTLTNIGNQSDVFDFQSSVVGDFFVTVAYYLDSDGSGSLSAGDALLADSDGDGLVDSGTVASAASLDILIVYQVPASAAGGTTITTSATSSKSVVASASVVDSLSIVPPPSLTISKAVVPISDPANGMANPFAIPGAVMQYTIRIENVGPGVADADSVVITDPIPVQGSLMVNDAGAGMGPVTFAEGSPASALSFFFGGLGDASDDVEFSADGGATFAYTPTPDGLGRDAAVTHIRLNPKGSFAANLGTGAPSAEFSFRLLIAD